MRAAWVVLLIGCGFQSRAANHHDDAGPGVPDAADSPDGAVAAGPICPSIAVAAPEFHASACATPVSGAIELAMNTSFDTDQGTSDRGLSCALVANGSAQLCVLAALSITIDPGIVLSAHGSAPFALFAHSITIRGTVDVASHVMGVIGAGSYSYHPGCSAGTLPKGAGGGRGGSAAGTGGNGGDEGNNPGSGGIAGASYGISELIGGCGGTRGGTGSAGGGSDGGTTTGGAGGGAVWIVSDTADLVLDAGARINASGAGGAGGPTQDHGGSGGGAGGLIVLQSPRIRLDPAAQVFANGGGGGGGAGINSGNPGFKAGDPGVDPTGPASGGAGGAGGTDGSGLVASATALGAGGGGAPNPNPGSQTDGAAGQDGGTDGHGGGGGGGAIGAIRVVSSTDIKGPNVSPDPVQLP